MTKAEYTGRVDEIIMCGIAGVAGKDARNIVQTMLEAIKHRGPDGSGIFAKDDIAIGNVLLKITGEKKQPITNGGALTFNGEIYNFKEMAQALGVTTDSDCEVLYEMIASYGIEAAVAKSDGDYAFAYAQNGKISLVRDPAGVKPLYYSTGNGFAFASEKKALIGRNEIKSLKPGHMLTFCAGNIIEKKITAFSSWEKLAEENKTGEMLFECLEQSVNKRYYKPCAIAFSGGIDSSLLAALCKDAKLYSIGMKGSHDIGQTKKAAQLLALQDNLHLHELTMDELESALPYVINAIGSADAMKVSIALPLYFASKDAHSDGIRVILSGQGADELFAGYKRYESMTAPELESALRKDLENIAQNNLERDDAVTMANSIELRVPYLDRKVVELAMGIAPELKIHNGVRKYILRLAASMILPDELVWKEKKAAQYSSGVYLAMEKLARKKGYKGALGAYLGEIKHKVPLKY